MYQFIGGGLLLYLLSGTWLELRAGKPFLYEVVEAILGGAFVFGVLYAVQFRNPLAAIIPLALYAGYRLARGGWPQKGFIMGIVDDIGDGFLLMLGLLMVLEKVEFVLKGISFNFFVG